MNEVIDWHQWFYYDETSPTCLRWKVSRYGGKKNNSELVAPGDMAGCFNKRSNGKGKCVYVSLERVNYTGHRIIWEMFNGPVPEGMVIDHLDRDAWNSKISNLIPKTTAENNRNNSKSIRNTSGVTGVYAHKHKGLLSHYAATWYDSGKKCSKYFLIKKYGDREAFKLACEYREKVIKQLNDKGAGYTDTHGK